MRYHVRVKQWVNILSYAGETMNAHKKGNDSNNEVAKAESKELGHLWETYVRNAPRCDGRCPIVVAALSAAGLVLIVAALFVDDGVAWDVVARVTQIFHDPGHDVLDPVRIERP